MAKPKRKSKLQQHKPLAAKATSPTLPVNPLDKRLLSVSIIVLIASILTCFGLEYLIYAFYHPDVAAIIEEARSVLIDQNAIPEPVEGMMTQVGMVAMPLLMVGFFFLLTKTKLKNIQWANYFNVVSIGFVVIAVILVYAGFSAANPFYMPDAGAYVQNSRDATCATNFLFYFQESILNTNSALYWLLLAPLFTALIVLFKRFDKQLMKPMFFRVLGVIGVCAYAGFYLYQVYQMFQFDFPYTWENQFDFSPVFYPITQVYAGTPMLTNDLQCNYGAYSWFLNPIFKIVGLDINSFTAVMATIIVITYAIYCLVLFKTVKTKGLVFLGWSTLLLFVLLLKGLVTPFDAVFSHAIRGFVPAITLLIAVFYLQKPSKILYVLGFIVLSYGIIWNPEFGLVCWFAYTATLCYAEFISSDWKKILQRCVKHIAVALLAIAFCFGSYAIITYVQFGKFPNLMSLFYSMMFFGKYGTGTLPMTLVHPWNLVILIDLIGLVYAIQALFHKQHLNYKTKIIFLVSIIGIGSFTYFSGRSHNWNIVPSALCPIILLTIFADNLISNQKLRHQSIAFVLAEVLIVAFLGFSCIDLYHHQKTIRQVSLNKAANEEEKQTKQRVVDNATFIHAVEHRTTAEVFIHTSVKYQALLFGDVLKKSAYNPSIIDLFTQKQLSALENKVLTDTMDVFIESSSFYYPRFYKVNAAMAATYTVDTTNGNMGYLKKRKYSVLPQSVLTNVANPQTLFYEKYTDDTASMKKRIQGAVSGIDIEQWQESMSISVVWFADKQLYPYSSLLSSGAPGDSIQSSISLFTTTAQPQTYYFSWERYQVGWEVELGTWNYVVIQARQNYMEVFLNGKMIRNYIIPHSIKRLETPLYIANMANQNQHFMGAISEVLVSKQNFTPAQIAETDKKVRAGGK